MGSVWSPRWATKENPADSSESAGFCVSEKDSVGLRHMIFPSVAFDVLEDGIFAPFLQAGGGYLASPKTTGALHVSPPT